MLDPREDFPSKEPAPCDPPHKEPGVAVLKELE